MNVALQKSVDPFAATVRDAGGRDSLPDAPGGPPPAGSGSHPDEPKHMKSISSISPGGAG